MRVMRGERGSALVMVLLLMTLMAALAGGAALIAQSGIQSARTDRILVERKYALESAVCEIAATAEYYWGNASKSGSSSGLFDDQISGVISGWQSDMSSWESSLENGLLEKTSIWGGGNTVEVNGIEMTVSEIDVTVDGSYGSYHSGYTEEETPRELYTASYHYRYTGISFKVTLGSEEYRYP